MADRDAGDRLILALDVDTKERAEWLIGETEGVISFFKIGYQLFIREGKGFVEELVGRGKRVFLDLKMDDVEETIRQAVAAIASTGVEFLTIHGNGATARAARDGRGGNEKPKLISLTLLSSLDKQDLEDLYIVGKNKRFKTLEDYVIWRAGQALESGCDGLIASGETVRTLREKFGPDKLIITPGIRPAGSKADDHKRTATPGQAIAMGADYLVVGRPIRDSDDPKKAAEAIVEEIRESLERRKAGGGSGGERTQRGSEPDDPGSGPAKSPRLRAITS